MEIKTSLVEYIFRRVWENQQGISINDLCRNNGSGSDDEETKTDTPVRVVKISHDALKMSSEFLRLFIVDALYRAQMEAMVDDSPAVEPHHVEQILAQLLLDF